METETTEREFFSELLDMFDDVEKFVCWLSVFLEEKGQEPKILDCRHNKTRPDSAKPCSYFQWGSKDKGKGIGIRKSTVLNHAAKYLGLEKMDLKSSTKIRVHSLSYLMKGGDPYDALVELVDNPKLVIAHLCGCGICGSVPGTDYACNEPTHLVLVEQSQNRKEVLYHEILAALKDDPDLYKIQCIIFKKININVF